MNLATYPRARTMVLLHRFLRTALSLGRLPSIVGREIFRTRMRTQPARALEDAVLFVCDVERCITALDAFEQRLIAFCILEDHSEWEASRQFQASQRNVSRCLARALDLLHESFCRKGLLRPLAEGVPQTCAADSTPAGDTPRRKT